VSLTLQSAQQDQLGLHPYSQLMKIKRRGLRQALGLPVRSLNTLLINAQCASFSFVHGPQC
jgi:hypothetical protein